MKNKFLLFLMMLLLPIVATQATSLKTDSLIYKTLIEKGYSQRHASYWVMVSKFETANYTSDLFRYHNNLWGMSYFRNGARPTKGTYRVYYNGKPTRFAGYKTKQAAVEEIVLYLEHANYPKDFNDLKSFILFMKKKGYFEEPFWYYYSAISVYK